MLQTVSGSNGYQAAYLQPYDFNPSSQNYLPPYAVGRTFWDNRYNDWAWYAATGSGASFFRMHLGKEVSIGVHNPYSVTLPRLSAVYIGTSSIVGQYQPDVYLAVADGTGQHANVAGVVRNDIPSGSNGFILVSGVMHRTNMGTFNVGDTLWLSTSSLGGLTTVEPGQPYEQVRIGYCSETGSLGSFICDRYTVPIPPQAYAGITSNIVVTNNNDGTVTLSTGSVNLFSNAQGSGVVTGYPLPQTTFTLFTGSNVDNYIVAQQSGSSTTAWYQLLTNRSSIDNITIVPVVAINARYESPGQWELHEFNFGPYGLALANKENYKDTTLNATQRQSGLTLFITGSGTDFGITAGSAWYGVNLTSLAAFQSSNTASCDTYHYISSASNWTFTTTAGYDNGHYNDPTSGSITLTANSWSVNFIYRIVDTTGNADVALVLASQQFDNAINAQANAKVPPNLPTFITDFGLLAGAIIVQSGSTIPTIISAYTNQFAPTSVNQHNSLLGLQGGTGGQYYHSTAAEYAGTGTGVFLRTLKPSFAGATPGNIPYWGNDQTLTLTGSITVVSNQYLSVNSGSLDPVNPEALLVKQLNTTSENTIGAYSTVNDFSQIYNQNYSSGSNASTDIVATADIGDQSNHFIDMGVGSSQYADPRWPWVKALDTYVEAAGGDMWLATVTDNKILFAFNNTASTNYADKTGFYLSGSFFGTASKAISASWAPFPLSASWSSASIYAFSSSFASSSISASVVLISASSANINYPIAFVQSSGSQPLLIDVGVSITYNPTTDTLTVPNISSSVYGTSSWATSTVTASVSIISSSTGNVNYPIIFASQTGSTTILMDTGGTTYYNPGTDTLTVPTISSSFLTGSLFGTASNAVSASWAPSSTAVSASWASQSLSSSYLINNQGFVNQSLSIAYAIALG